MSDKKLRGEFASSDNPDEISKRVKGVVLALSSVIIYFAASLFNITLTASDMVGIATQLGMVAGAVTTIYGAGVALINKFARQ
jgi:hypothetical protein